MESTAPVERRRRMESTTAVEPSTRVEPATAVKSAAATSAREGVVWRQRDETNDRKSKDQDHLFDGLHDGLLSSCGSR
jgi:hypothetical protein